MSSIRLQMQGGTGKMSNRYGVASDQFLCLYFSFPDLFCSWFCFLLCLPLGVFLAASLSPQHLGEVPGGCFSYKPGVQIQHCGGLWVLGVLCDSSRTQLNAQRRVKVQSQPHPSWAELLQKAGARDHSGTYPTASTGDAKFDFCSSALAGRGRSFWLKYISLFLPEKLSFPSLLCILQCLCHHWTFLFQGSRGTHNYYCLLQLPMLYRSALSFSLNY